MLEYFLNEHPISSLLIIIAIVTAIAVVVVAIPAHFAADHTCAKRAEILETEYQYGFWQGCWVRGKDGAWVEYNTIRNVGTK
jgi:hypothetical protein